MVSRVYESTILALSITFLATGSGFAQKAASAPKAAYEKVTVYAPFVVRKVINPMMSKASSTGLEVISISRVVTFSDLDLSMPDGVKTLEDRVRQAAHDACAEIEKRYPKSRYVPVPENQDCIGNATAEGMIVVKQLEIAAARY